MKRPIKNVSIVGRNDGVGVLMQEGSTLKNINKILFYLLWFVSF